MAENKIMCGQCGFEELSEKELKEVDGGIIAILDSPLYETSTRYVIPSPTGSSGVGDLSSTSRLDRFTNGFNNIELLVRRALY